MPQLISPSGRRSATIGRSVDPALVIASLGYTELTANGTGLTKRAAKEHTSEIGIGLKPEDPLGFKGLKSCQEEMDKANIYTKKGYRTNQVVGILVLDPHKLRSWLESKRSLFPKGFDPLSELDKIEKNSDVPAILLRFTHPRYEDTTEKSYTNDTDYAYHQDQMNQSHLATIKVDIAAHGSVKALMEYYQMNTLPRNLRKKLNKTLTYAQKNPVSKSGRPKDILKGLASLNAYLLGFELAQNSWEMENGTLVQRAPYGFKPQDTSIGAFWNDYENLPALERWKTNDTYQRAQLVILSFSLAVGLSEEIFSQNLMPLYATTAFDNRLAYLRQQNSQSSQARR